MMDEVNCNLKDCLHAGCRCKSMAITPSYLKTSLIWKILAVAGPIRGCPAPTHLHTLNVVNFVEKVNFINKFPF